MDQKMEALRHANEIRSARAQLKRELAERKVSPLEVLEDPPDYAANMSLREFLCAVRKLGPAKVDRLLSRTGISPHKPIGQLTPHQIWILDERFSSQNAWLQALSVR